MRSTTVGAAIHARGVHVRYKGADRPALDDLNFEITPGEVCVLLGPSGCGKSTLLRTMNALIPLDAGSLLIDEVEISRRDPIALRREIGYVIQSGGLFPHYTVAENIAIVPRLLHWEPATISARVTELLQLVQLDPGRYAQRRPSSLSGGEMQRVGVARALAARPPLLLMDEPFGALDPMVRKTLQTELISGIRALGTTIVFVTHDVDEAVRIADRIMIMRAGRIEQFATPSELFRGPANAWRSEFIGSGDLLRRLEFLPLAEYFQRRKPPIPANVHADWPRISIEGNFASAIAALLAQPQAPGLAVYDGATCVGNLQFAELAAALGAQ